VRCRPSAGEGTAPSAASRDGKYGIAILCHDVRCDGDLRSGKGQRLGGAALVEALLVSGHVLALGGTRLRIDIDPGNVLR